MIMIKKIRIHTSEIFPRLKNRKNLVMNNRKNNNKMIYMREKQQKLKQLNIKFTR